MPSYWISDAQARVLGPINLDALRELIAAGRIHGIARVSRDGQVWEPVEQFAEIAALQAAHTGQACRVRERREAERLRAGLEAMRGRPAHEVFGLSADAGLDATRAAFFRLVKRFYPDDLAPDAEPLLREVRTEIFGFLSGLMASIERQAPAAPAATPAPSDAKATAAPSSAAPARRAPPVLAPSGAKAINKAAVLELRRTPGVHAERPEDPPPRVRPPATVPSYTPQEFVGFERRCEDRVRVAVEVSVRTCSIFTVNKLLNISTGGAFIPSQEALALGEKLELVFRFDDPRREVKATGSVVWWNAGDAKVPRGFGVRFTDLALDDRQFIERYIQAHDG